ncbi:hypothetical protein EJ08DRAFT_695556 [Tothia fuscella]|uniref:Uncharacterized protein n=1 Tax=Tothia fuscella TaxID=1048955 RepID=A0A9P4NUF1_9PEZI|nr:hypothetical protein EJ08DRAFT_695556 [Tothia fuscella]
MPTFEDVGRVSPTTSRTQPLQQQKPGFQRNAGPRDATINVSVLRELNVAITFRALQDMETNHAHRPEHHEQQQQSMQFLLGYHFQQQQHLLPPAPSSYISHQLQYPLGVQAFPAPLLIRSNHPSLPYSALRDPTQTQFHTQTQDLTELSFHAIMELLGREDTALLLRARILDHPHEPIQTAMFYTLQDIEHHYQNGTINRAVGPLNADNEFRDGGWLHAVYGYEFASKSQSDRAYPFLAIRNDAMLDTARRLANYGEAELWRCLESAHQIFFQRSNGRKGLDQR